MKSKTMNRRLRWLFATSLAFAMILACAAMTTSCGKESKPPELKKVNIKDTYVIKDGKVKVAPLIVIYHDKKEGSEFDKQLTDYQFYVNEEEVSIDEDGFLEQEMKPGEYTFKIKWIYNEKAEEYEKTVEIKGEDTWGKYPELIGKTYAEIKQQYGELDLEKPYYDGGGQFNKIKGLEIWVTLQRGEGEETVVDTPRDTDTCYAVQGELGAFFHNIKDSMTWKELQSLLDISLEYFDEGEWGAYCVGTIQDKETMFVFLDATKGMVTPKTYITIKRADE